MLTQTQYADWKFVARIHEIKTFYTGVKSLNFGDLNGSLNITEAGLRCTVDSDGSTRASLFMTSSCFDEYHVVDNVKFGISMNVLVECLSIFNGIDCSLKMFYKGDGAPLIMVFEPLEKDDTTTECAIRTTKNLDPTDFTFNDNNSSLNVIFIRGHDLANIFSEMDKSAQTIEIMLSPRVPYFKISALGAMQSTISVGVTKTSDSVISFNCRYTTIAKYNNSQIRLMKNALLTANKVAIKTDSSGLLEMQFMVLSTDQSEMYLQFFVTSITDIDE